eukprot:6214807-Pleurochrysis_carterae.AAC.3
MRRTRVAKIEAPCAHPPTQARTKRSKFCRICDNCAQRARSFDEEGEKLAFGDARTPSLGRGFFCDDRSLKDAPLLVHCRCFIGSLVNGLASVSKVHGENRLMS